VKLAAKVLGTIAIIGILVTLVAPIVQAESIASAKSEKWRCKRLTCAKYDKNYRKTGGVVFYGTVVHVTKRQGGWLRSDFNSSVARVNYIQAQFSFVRYG
jgi:hypothetical protein